MRWRMRPMNGGNDKVNDASRDNQQNSGLSPG